MFPNMVNRFIPLNRRITGKKFRQPIRSQVSQHESMRIIVRLLNERLLISSMLPFETDVLGEITKNCVRVMPKVVPDQRSKFETDELFRKLSRDGEVEFNI